MHHRYEQFIYDTENVSREKSKEFQELREK